MNQRDPRDDGWQDRPHQSYCAICGLAASEGGNHIECELGAPALEQDEPEIETRWSW